MLLLALLFSLFHARFRTHYLETAFAPMHDMPRHVHVSMDYTITDGSASIRQYRHLRNCVVRNICVHCTHYALTL